MHSMKIYTINELSETESERNIKKGKGIDESFIITAPQIIVQ